MPDLMLGDFACIIYLSNLPFQLLISLCYFL